METKLEHALRAAKELHYQEAYKLTDKDSQDGGHMKPLHYEQTRSEYNLATGSHDKNTRQFLISSATDHSFFEGQVVVTFT